MSQWGRYVQIAGIMVVSLCSLLAAVASMTSESGVTAGGTSLALTGVIGLQVGGYMISIESKLRRDAGKFDQRRSNVEEA